jgi:hypothetical protein
LGDLRKVRLTDAVTTRRGADSQHIDRSGATAWGYGCGGTNRV